MNPVSGISRSYCASRFQGVRRLAREVAIGEVLIGGNHPLAVQSMTTTPTLDIEATIRQSIELAEAGCDIIRITAQNVQAAEALGVIRKQFSAAGFSSVPLVADIHFLPQAALEAAKHVEKVRINPGNYADKKKFAVKEYSDREYEAELQRLFETFSPIVRRCRELGRSMRIGTNHGSLSDRIMNRYGDTPLGMCESALEFIRIAESHGFHDIILSMKASNPKVMIQAYRLMVAKMEMEGMDYPLHLGVTEAGDGDDGRIKSAIGIGSLIYDGLGDTIRVSLTEDPVAEVPVARSLADKAMALWTGSVLENKPDPVNPFEYHRREVAEGHLGTDTRLGPLEPPVVIQPGPDLTAVPDPATYAAGLEEARVALKATPIEGLLLKVHEDFLDELDDWRSALEGKVAFVVWDVDGLPMDAFTLETLRTGSRPGDVWLRTLTNRGDWITLSEGTEGTGIRTAMATSPEDLLKIFPEDLSAAGDPALLTLSEAALLNSPFHPLGRYRQLTAVLQHWSADNPIWIRNTLAAKIQPDNESFNDHLLEASILTGSLLCDGIGDLVSVETIPAIRQSTTLAYNILQGARARTTKTEFVACPSCGRTLFDLQATTQRIREATGHLKGVTIAVMGCIVNGPGEMADADFGYVGGAPGKVNLYVGKKCVQYHIPAGEAVEALTRLIREHGKWTEPAADA